MGHFLRWVICVDIRWPWPTFRQCYWCQKDIKIVARVIHCSSCSDCCLKYVLLLVVWYSSVRCHLFVLQDENYMMRLLFDSFMIYTCAFTKFYITEWLKWKCSDLKCVRISTRSRLSQTHHANKSSCWAGVDITRPKDQADYTYRACC